MAALRKGTFSGANVFLSRSLVPPELFDALHDALNLNGGLVFLCCDPSRTGPNDYHIISSVNHEKFTDLRAKGCNLLGPHCVLSCAKELRILPKQGYTCCLALDGVKVITSGFEKNEKVEIEELITAMGGVLQSKPSKDVSCVIIKNVLADKYKWALNILMKPIVTISWLKQCWDEHRFVPHEAYIILPFKGLTICVTKIPAGERKEIEKMIIHNGGSYSADLTKKCTHLVSDSPGGDKFMVAQKWGHIHIVTRRWVDQCIARKACLDEGLYPVQGNSSSSRDLRSFQKEKSDQEHNNATTQSIQPPNMDDVYTTSSQNVPSSVVGTEFINENTNTPTLPMKTETKIDTNIAEDSESEDNDLYLADCRICLVGFAEAELSRLVMLLRKGGGTRHMLLGEKLTHIIIGSPSSLYVPNLQSPNFPFSVVILVELGGTNSQENLIDDYSFYREKKEIRHLAACGVINVVKATWLEECDLAKKEVHVTTRHITSKLLFQKESIADNGVIEVKSCPGVSHATVINILDDKKLEADSFSERKKEREKSGTDSDMAFARFPAKFDKDLSALNKLSRASCKSQALSDTMHTESIRSSITFKGKTFCFSASFPQDRRDEVKEWIREGGGTILDDQQKMKVHFVIERHGILQFPIDASQCAVVSSQWIRTCLEDGCIQDIGNHIIYSPLRCHIPLPGFENLWFSISQYEEKERVLLRNLCFTLGAKFTEKMTKKVTHLLCKFTNGPKYEAACKWGIQPITAEWINECISKDMIVPIDSFWPKPVTAQEREAGLCTVSQYPTQAALVLSECLPSQLPSQTQGQNNKRIQNAGCTEDHKVLGDFSKRSRLLDGDSSCDSFKKKKLLEDPRVIPDATPDVAEAIEDLLAQSSMIQDMKSPAKPGCDRNIFAPDHCLLEQDDSNPNNTFGLMRHFTDRTEKLDAASNVKGNESNGGIHDPFSETQTESQVVVYEEDLSGRQKIIDRVRSQSMTSTPDK